MKKEQTYQELLVQTWSTPDAVVVTTENHFPTENSENTLNNYQNNEIVKVILWFMFTKEVKMNQWRPAKPEEINILKEQNQNIPPTVKIQSQEPKIMWFDAIKSKVKNFSQSFLLMKSSLEAKLTEVKAKTKIEEEKKERLKKSHKYEIEGITEEINFLQSQNSNFGVSI